MIPSTGRLGQVCRSGFVHVLGAQGAARIFIALQGVLLARLLGPEDLGRFAVLASALTLSGIVAQAGIPSALSRYLPLSRHGEEQRGLRDGALATGVVWAAFVGLVVAMPMVGRLLSGESWVRTWLPVAILILPLQTAVQSSLSLLHGQARFPKKSLLETVVAALTFFLIITPAVPYGLSGAAWGKVSAAAVSAILVSAATGLRTPHRVPFPPGFWRFAVLSLASSSFSTMLHTADTLVLGAFRIPNADIGSYRLASMLYSFLSMVPAAAMHTLFPRLVKAHGDTPVLRRLCLQSVRYLVLFGAFSAIVGVQLIPPLLGPVVGQGFTPAAPYVRVLSVGLLFRSLVLWAGSVILALGRPGLNLILLVVTGGLNLALNIHLVPIYGPIGAAWATVASEAASALLGGGAVLHLIRASRG